MGLSPRARQWPARIATGAFILNSGIEKKSADDDTAQQIHGFAAATYPFLGGIEPKQFLTILAKSEIVLGVALLAPFVPAKYAGAGLAGFAAGLLGLYRKTPGMRHHGSLRPTPDGLPIAKDVWMIGIGIGIGLVLEGLTAKE